MSPRLVGAKFRRHMFNIMTVGTVLTTQAGNSGASKKP